MIFGCKDITHLYQNSQALNHIHIEQLRSSHNPRDTVKATAQWPWTNPRSSPREQEVLQIRNRPVTAPISHILHHMFAPRRPLTLKPSLTIRHPPQLTFLQAVHKQPHPQHFPFSPTCSPPGSHQHQPTAQPPLVPCPAAPTAPETPPSLCPPQRRKHSHKGVLPHHPHRRARHRHRIFVRAAVAQEGRCAAC
jgi:hypothetical protein